MEYVYRSLGWKRLFLRSNQQRFASHISVRTDKLDHELLALARAHVFANEHGAVPGRTLATNAPGLTVWPGPSILTNGFYIGSATNGTDQAHGMFDDLATYAYILTPDAISNLFFGVSIEYWANPLNLANMASAPYDPPVPAPGFRAIMGTGYVHLVSFATNCVTNSSVWLTNVTAKLTNNGTMNLTFKIGGGSPGILYDVYGADGLIGNSITNAQWAWLGQGYACNTYTITNLPGVTALFALGGPRDDDSDGLPNAFEALVSKTDPQNPDTYATGSLDWWQFVHFGSNIFDPYGDPDGDGWSNLQEFQNGTDPEHFNTPPAPSGLIVNYYSSVSGPNVAWNPNSGSVTNYVVRRVIPALDQTNYFSFSGITTFTDTMPTGAVPPDGTPADYDGPTYSVMAQYSGGDSDWSESVAAYKYHIYNYPDIWYTYGVNVGSYPWYYPDEDSYDNSISAVVVRGPQGRLFLAISALPEQVKTLRLWVSQMTNWWDILAPYPTLFTANYSVEEPLTFLQTPATNLFDIAVTNLVNGVYQIPVSAAPLYGNYSFTLQGVCADGKKLGIVVYRGFSFEILATDALQQCQSGAIPFLDGRRQIQENVEFQLRATGGTESCYGQTWPFNLIGRSAASSYMNHATFELANENYVFAGFHYLDHYYDPIYGPFPHTRLSFDAFHPFEQNYAYANLVYAPTNVNSDGQMTSAAAYDSYYLLNWDVGSLNGGQSSSFFSTHDFVGSSRTNTIPSQLFPDASRWILSRNLSGYGIESDCDPHPGLISNNSSNLFGLRLLSVLWPTNGYPLNYQVYYPGQTPPPQTNLSVRIARFFEAERPQLSTVDYYFARPKAADFEDSELVPIFKPLTAENKR